MARDDDDYEDDYEDDRPSRRGRKSREERPGKVQAIAIMTLIGGIYAILHFLGVGGGSSLICCLWPGLYYALVVGILAIIKGSQLLGQDARLQAPPKTIAILMIIEIINIDIICTVMGIIILVFCGDPEVEDFFRGS
jgi:hypothetical protein